MSKSLLLDSMVEKLQAQYPEKQIKVTFKYDKVILHFVTDKFYDIEFNSNYDCGITLMTLLNFTKDSVI